MRMLTQSLRAPCFCLRAAAAMLCLLRAPLRVAYAPGVFAYARQAPAPACRCLRAPLRVAYAPRVFSSAQRLLLRISRARQYCRERALHDPRPPRMGRA